MVSTVEALRKFAADYGDLILLMIAVGGAAIAVILRFPSRVLAWWKRRRAARAERASQGRFPTETIRAVLEHVGSYQGPSWSHASRNNGTEHGMQVYARWMFTNIAPRSVKIASVYLDLRPRVHGMALVRHSKENMHGDYFLHPGNPVPGSTSFFLFPAIRKPGQDLKADLVIVDNLGNEHRVRRVVFRGPPA
jgi:hypothetical protein